MNEKNKINSVETASEAIKEVVRLCSVCGELRNEPSGSLNSELERTNGKEETNT